MKSIKLLASAAALSLSVSGLTQAQDAPAAPEENPADHRWVGTVGAGLVLNSGNTETSSGHGLFDVTRNLGAWAHNVSIAALWTADSFRTTAEKYFGAWQSNRSLNERSYLFGYASYDDDRFSGFDYQATASLGYGYRVIMEEKMNLTVEAGPGIRVSEAFTFATDAAGENIIDMVDRIGFPVKTGTEDRETEAIARLAEAFDWQFSDNAKLFQELNIEAGSDNTVTRFLVGLETTVVGSIAMRVSYGIKNNSDVPAGVEKTDTETALTLAYTF